MLFLLSNETLENVVIFETVCFYYVKKNNVVCSPSERPKLNYKDCSDTTTKQSSANAPEVINTAPDLDVTMEDDSDDEDNSLCIDGEYC